MCSVVSYNEQQSGCHEASAALYSVELTDATPGKNHTNSTTILLYLVLIYHRGKCEFIVIISADGFSRRQLRRHSIFIRKFILTIERWRFHVFWRFPFANVTNTVVKILLLLLLKPVAQTQVEKNVVCASQPHKYLRHGKQMKHNSGKQPTVDCALERIQRSGIKYTVGKITWEVEGDILQLTPTPENNIQGLGEQMENGNEVPQRCLQIYVSPTSKYQFYERHRNNTTRIVWACCQTSNQGCQGWD